MDRGSGVRRDEKIDVVLLRDAQQLLEIRRSCRRDGEGACGLAQLDEALLESGRGYAEQDARILRAGDRVGVLDVARGENERAGLGLELVVADRYIYLVF